MFDHSAKAPENKASPSHALAELDAMTDVELKAYGVSLGVISEGSRRLRVGMLWAIRQHLSGPAPVEAVTPAGDPEPELELSPEVAAHPCEVPCDVLWWRVFNHHAEHQRGGLGSAAVTLSRKKLAAHGAGFAPPLWWRRLFNSLGGDDVWLPGPERLLDLPDDSMPRELEWRKLARENACDCSWAGMEPEAGSRRRYDDEPVQSMAQLMREAAEERGDPGGSANEHQAVQPGVIWPQAVFSEPARPAPAIVPPLPPASRPPAALTAPEPAQPIPPMAPLTPSRASRAASRFTMPRPKSRGGRPRHRLDESPEEVVGIVGAIVSRYGSRRLAARVLGFDEKQIRRWLTGSSMPTMKQLAKMKRELRRGPRAA